MYWDRVYLNNVLGLGIAQYVLKLGIAQQFFEIGYILTMSWDWVWLSNVLVFENCSAMYWDRVYLNNVLGLGIAQYVLKLGIAKQFFEIGYILTMCWDWV